MSSGDHKDAVLCVELDVSFIIKNTAKPKNLRQHKDAGVKLAKVKHLLNEDNNATGITVW